MWWENINRCYGKTKKGLRCKFQAMQSYEIEKGHLFIPLTCEKHKNQEKELRTK